MGLQMRVEVIGFRDLINNVRGLDLPAWIMGLWSY